MEGCIPVVVGEIEARHGERGWRLNRQAEQLFDSLLRGINTKAQVYPAECLKQFEQ